MSDTIGTCKAPVGGIGERPCSEEPSLIALASNELYFPGLYCTVVSALATLARTRRTSLHILDGGVSVSSKARLEAMAGRIRPGTLIEWLPIDEGLFREAPLGPGKSRMAYARIVLPDLLAASKCVYLDCDILVFRDLAELFDLHLNPGAVLAAVLDSETLTVASDAPLVAAKMGLSAAAPYFNSGVLLMDLTELRRERLLIQALEFLHIWKGHYRYWDQSALNCLLHNRIHWLPEHWNRASWLFDEQEDNHLECVLHYTSSAPWLGRKPGPAQALFERFAEDWGACLEQSSPQIRSSRRRWLWRNALAPLRAVALPIVSRIYKLAGHYERAAAYHSAARYWINFIRSAPARTQRFHRRIEEIRKMRFGRDISLSSL